MKRVLTFLVLLLLFARCDNNPVVPALTTNAPPIANAGRQQTIILPLMKLVLDGSKSADPERGSLRYAWTKIAGPSAYFIQNPNAALTDVTNLEEGTYQFELKVTDIGGLSAKDTTEVQVITQQTVTTKPVACDFSSGRPEIAARLIPVGTLSQARGGMAVAWAGSKILFAGATLSAVSGSLDSDYGSSTVDIYDVVTQTWSKAKLSKSRSDIAAVAAGNKVFFAGGRLGDGANDQLFTTVDIYDVSTNTWSVASLSEPRAFIGAAAVGNKVFFAGGEKNWNYETSNRVDIYDLSSGTWSTANLSENRAYIAAVTADNKVYFAGGHIDNRWYDSPSRTIDIYDNGTNSWSTSRLLEPRGMSSGIAVGDNIYWAGGLRYSGGVADESDCSVEIRNIHSQVSRLEGLFKPASWVTVEGQNAVVKDNKILYFRHYNTDDTSRFDIYDIASGSWSIGVLPKSITGVSIIAVNNTVYIAGGMVDGKLSNQVWKLEF
ncbi:hypothetical protein GCM10023189_55860 [Nibrella saemangeumensis]|uniref:N-acetylneuraminic acid mutarotase n=1 Tax=Nibrella saemangeumensis TaxID=1084526 RepID=A0ABP8NQ08_9BACT